MKLLTLDDAGKKIRETEPLEDSNWVWLSPDGKFLLRWVNSIKSLVKEELGTGKKFWELSKIQPAISTSSDGFVQPIWGINCVLVSDCSSGNIEAIDLQGRRLWRLKNMKWECLPGISPVIPSSSGVWLAVGTAQVTYHQLAADRGIEYFSVPIDGSDYSVVADTIKLMHIRMSLDNPGEQDQANIVWQRTIATEVGSEPRRMNPYTDGNVLSMDLFELRKQDKSFPIVAILTDTALTTLSFNNSGNLKEESSWPVSNVAGIDKVWLLSENRILVKRPNTTSGQRQALQIIDRTGTVLWEMKPPDPIQSVGFDPQRRYMIVSMSHAVWCYDLTKLGTPVPADVQDNAN